MIPYTLDTIEYDITECVKKLVNALAEQDYDGFYQMLDTSVWTLEDLKEFASLNLDMGVDAYGAYDEPCCLPDRVDFLYEFDDETGFAVEYDLTTNGECNDWTLQLEFLYAGDFLKVGLEDIHIL